MEFLLAGVALVGLAVGTYTDIRTREVPDWANFGMILAGLGIRAAYAADALDFSILLSGLLGLGVCFLAASAMYYAGQWGGGDSKLLMGIGSLMGIDLPLRFVLGSLPNLLVFWLLLLFTGALYGMAVSVVLSLKNRDRLLAQLAPMVRQSRLKLAAVVGFSLALAAFGILADPYMRLLSFAVAGIGVLTMLLWLYVRAVEVSCMIKDTPVGRLVEGDWIAEDVVVDGKRLCGPKDLGIERKQIALLQELAEQGKLVTVRVKEGIPFVPPFLFAFILTWVWPLQQLL
ncbi:prepilin peptidase [Candidatus Woesearchaeota archaeon]|nr:prepilin peptidase [Candidatus Woesearchaeota archaeon]